MRFLLLCIVFVLPFGGNICFLQKGGGCKNSFASLLSVIVRMRMALLDFLPCAEFGPRKPDNAKACIHPPKPAPNLKTLNPKHLNPKP